MRTKIITLFLCIWLSLSGCMLFVVKANAGGATTSGGDVSTRRKKREAQWTGHMSYVTGYKRLSNEWSPAEHQIDLGIVDLDFRGMNWPISIAIQILASRTAGNDIPDEPGFEGKFSGTCEFNLGVRKVWENSSRFHPFFGGGLSVIGGSVTETYYGGGDPWYYRGEYHDHYQGESDAEFGYWAGTGFYWMLSESFHLGINAQYSSGKIELFNKNLDAGGIHLNAMIGYHW